LNRVPDLSVVVPTFNEEARIGSTLREIHEFLTGGQYEYEIIVVDDGSTDGTVSLVENIAGRMQGLRLLVNDTNRGKGFSVRKGFMNARGEILVFTDADLSTPIEELVPVLCSIGEGYPVVLGSRALAGSRITVRQARHREAMGKIFNLLVRMLTPLGFKDTQCGFKCFRKEAAQEICGLMTVDGFGFDVEMLLIAGRLGYRIKEVPVRWSNRPESKVGLVSGSMGMLADLIRIRLNDLRGFYRDRSSRGF
jgi:dolichyl-phosphate beta-glucosyltransferase